MTQNKGDIYKEKGNNYLKQQKYEEAKEQYTLAINENPLEAIYYANRSLAEIKLNQYENAEKDINLAVQCNPKYVKAYLRRALILMHFKRYEDAKTDYQVVLKFEKNNKEALEGLKKIEKEIVIETKLSKEVKDIKIEIKVPETLPKNFEYFERDWSELNDEQRNEYLNFIGTKHFKLVCKDNLTTDMLNCIAKLKKNESEWRECIKGFPRFNLLKIFANEETKKWLNEN